MLSNLPKLNIQTLYDLARTRCEEHPDRVAITFLTDGDEKTEELTYAGLDSKARQIAAALQCINAKNKTVLLVFAPGLDFICAFFGCQYAGAIAVPAYAPSNVESWKRVQDIAADAGASIILSNSKLKNKIAEIIEDAIGLEWILTDKLNADASIAWQPPANDPTQIAFLQYTSGSTGTPKGVMISHLNILHNSFQIHKNFRTDSKSTGVIWLPPYHDMGLIGGIIQPLYTGFPVILLSPMHFIQHPLRWLRAISKYRGTVSGGPNFSFDLCAKIPVEDCKGLDLSCWESAFIGAEPVRKRTLDNFIRKFAPFGFNPDALMPCYGLAESTLFVTGRRHGDADSSIEVDLASFSLGRLKRKSEENDFPSLKIVSSGKPQDGTAVRIVDPVTHAICSPGVIGEIWVAGQSISCGYWNKPSINKTSFEYLCTGDTGFMEEGELYVTGRINDKIIINGKNFFPQDIEQIVEAIHPNIIANGSAAFSIINAIQKEELIIVCELKRETPPEELTGLRNGIKQKILFHFGIPVTDVAFIRQSSLPRTSSGKIRRSRCKEQYLSNLLKSFQKLTV